MSKLLLRQFQIPLRTVSWVSLSAPCRGCRHRQSPFQLSSFRSLHSTQIIRFSEPKQPQDLAPDEITDAELDKAASEDANEDQIKDTQAWLILRAMGVNPNQIPQYVRENPEQVQAFNDLTPEEAAEYANMSPEEAEEWDQYDQNSKAGIDDPVAESWRIYNNHDFLPHVPPFERCKSVFEAEDDPDCLYALVAAMRRTASTKEQVRYANEAELHLQATFDDHASAIREATTQIQKDEKYNEILRYSSWFLKQHQHYMALLRLFNTQLTAEQVTFLMSALKSTVTSSEQTNILLRLLNRLNRVVPDLDWKYRHEFGKGPPRMIEDEFGELIEAADMVQDKSMNGVNAILNASDLDPKIAGLPVLMAPPTYDSMYPNLMTPDPILDSREVLDLPPGPDTPFHNRVISRSHQSFFHEAALKGFDPESFDPMAVMGETIDAEQPDTPSAPSYTKPAGSSQNTATTDPPNAANATEAQEAPPRITTRQVKMQDDALHAPSSGMQDVDENADWEHWTPHTSDSLVAEPPSPPSFASKAFKFQILYRNTKQQTGKGIIRHKQSFFIVGNQAGLIGIGSGKIDHAEQGAQRVAELDAFKRVDWVERFEDRTIWTELRHKFRATEIIMRPRPPGFGLRCHPTLYQVFKACGIKDISAKVWGSRNPLQVAYCAINMLHSGHNPLGLGNGYGGKGRRMWKGVGMKGKREVELARGRRIVAHRK